MRWYLTRQLLMASCTQQPEGIGRHSPSGFRTSCQCRAHRTAPDSVHESLSGLETPLGKFAPESRNQLDDLWDRSCCLLLI